MICVNPYTFIAYEQYNSFGKVPEDIASELESLRLNNSFPNENPRCHLTDDSDGELCQSLTSVALYGIATFFSEHVFVPSRTV